jgi:hypothetical protein
MGTPTLLGKLTTAVAIVFMVTSFSLALMAQRHAPSVMPAATPPAPAAVPAPAPAVPAAPAAPGTPAPPATPAAPPPPGAPPASPQK